MAVIGEGEERRERRWTLLEAAVGAVFTLAARQAATRVWYVLTGERPPGS